MRTKFSDNDILRFLYDEMSEDENTLFLDALTEDENLWARYEQLQQTSDQVSSLSFEPSEASIDAIMDVVKEESPKSKKFAKVRKLSRSPISMSLAVAVFLTLLMFGRVGSDVKQSNSQEVSLEYEPMPVPTLVHEVRMEMHDEPQINWQTEELDTKLSEIKQKAQSLSDDPLL